MYTSFICSVLITTFITVYFDNQNIVPLLKISYKNICPHYQYKIETFFKTDKTTIQVQILIPEKTNVKWVKIIQQQKQTVIYKILYTYVLI